MRKTEAKKRMKHPEAISSFCDALNQFGNLNKSFLEKIQDIQTNTLEMRHHIDQTVENCLDNSQLSRYSLDYLQFLLQRNKSTTDNKVTLSLYAKLITNNEILKIDDAFADMERTLPYFLFPKKDDESKQNNSKQTLRQTTGRVLRRRTRSRVAPKYLQNTDDSSSQTNSSDEDYESGNSASLTAHSQVPSSLSEQNGCYCDGQEFGQVVYCSNTNCERHWFHLACLHMEDYPSKQWICDRCLEKA
ncbi:hypothetical protein SJAG_00510 [Schizosaccharomyces japonicus yFS275]|uniref:PHD-type domain-containing protein n=1 Tax=Schizosaccharomyces japonicus (strain yFS275 / FY16936) TaxID=402676 RepID=B6JVU4_SCHJY|nr:hypothetical protein SJAG_00510 [Schizosaccharomyces japonicus yFS275]EEB05495.2 hypothetical protein SJAG_00510 [Schizosaccharomyces japonicus yFS275]